MSRTCPATSHELPRVLKRVIIAGFGPVGRCVADHLRADHVEVTIIDLNPATIITQTRLGLKAVHGDVTDPAVLAAAGIEHADVLILAVPDDEVVIKACAAARKLSPRIFIEARTNFVSRGLLATEAGADHVTIEEIVTADAMRNAVVRHLSDEESSTAAE